MPDYECWPLWDMDNLGDIDPDVLPISSSLKKNIDKWRGKYDSTLNWDDPASSGFQSNEEERNFVEQGWEIFHKLQEELPDIEIIPHGYLFEKYPNKSNK